MDAATIRLKELKDEMRKIELSEYHYIDGALIELKLMPHDVEILHPALFYPRPIDIQDMWEKIQVNQLAKKQLHVDELSYFQKGDKIYIPPPPPPPEIEENPAEGQESPIADSTAEGNKEKSQTKIDVHEEQKPGDRRRSVDQKAKKKRQQTPKTTTKLLIHFKPSRPRPKKFVPQEPELTPEEIEAKKKQEVITSAVKIIQTHERARQARIYYMDIHKIFLMRQQLKQPGQKPAPDPDPEVEKQAATIIEKYWRGHCTKEYVKRRERERRLLIGKN